MADFSSKDTNRLLVEAIEAETGAGATREKIFELAREGQISPDQRGTLYRYALGVITLDKSSEMTLLKCQEEEYSMLLDTRRRAGELRHMEPWRRYRSDAAFMATFGHPAEPSRRRIENVLDALEVALPRCPADTAAAAVNLLVPMAFVNPERESDVYFCVRSLVQQMLQPGGLLRDLQQQCALFLAAFHATNETLYQHFFREEVDVFAWLPAMLSSLFVGTLPPETMYVVFDMYLTGPLGLGLHPWAVLALLGELSDLLIEHDSEGILSILRAKPIRVPINAKRLLLRARAIAEDARRAETG